MATNKEIVETALSYEGKLTYEWGGDNIAGGYGDCSDFTQHVYAVHGYNIGGYTGAQIEQGAPVAKADLLPGDLLFFKNTITGKAGLSHVGIYIGDGKFIHLGNAGCVKADLNSSYWTNHYMDARRIQSVSYVDYDPGDVTVTPENTENTEATEKTGVAGLEWWGDIVKIVVIILLLVGGVVLAASSVGVKLKGVIPA